MVVSKRPTGNRIFSRSWDRADICVRLRARLLPAGRAEFRPVRFLLSAASPADGEDVFAARPVGDRSAKVRTKRDRPMRFGASTDRYPPQLLRCYAVRYANGAVIRVMRFVNIIPSFLFNR